MQARYVVIYRKHGSSTGLMPGVGDLETVKRTARSGLIRHGADEFEVRADNSDGATVWQESLKSAAEKSVPPT